MNKTKLPNEIKPVRYNELDVLEITHSSCSAKVALQGAHLFSWQPKHAKQDVLWLSEIEPFKQGCAIRGGVPICYPNFAAGLDGKQAPFHGFARTALWELDDATVEADGVHLTFRLQSYAKLEMRLGASCEIRFTHQSDTPSQLALHSYFKLADIRQTEISGLPEHCFDALSQTQQTVTNPRKIAENVDCIYQIEQPLSVISDLGNARHIEIEHQNAGEIVLWNPWHKPTAAMSEQGYQTMVCIETARIHRLLAQNETVAVKINVK